MPRRKAAADAPQNAQISVLLVDDHGLVRDGLRCRFPPHTDLNAAAAALRRALQAGASGYRVEEAGIEEIVRAVHALSAARRQPGAQRAESSVLTPTETEILRLVVDGHSNSRVAQRLGLSPRTVEAYRLRLMRKLGIGHLPALVKYAIRHGIAQIE